MKQCSHVLFLVLFGPDKLLLYLSKHQQGVWVGGALFPLRTKEVEDAPATWAFLVSYLNTHLDRPSTLSVMANKSSLSSRRKHGCVGALCSSDFPLIETIWPSNFHYKGIQIGIYLLIVYVPLGKIHHWAVFLWYIPRGCGKRIEIETMNDLADKIRDLPKTLP